MMSAEARRTQRKSKATARRRKFESGVLQGHCERHPYVATGATERAGSGSWDKLLLSFRLRAVFRSIQKFRDAQAAGGADALVPGDAVVGDAAGNSIHFFLQATFRLGARFILALHFLLPLLECCRHYDLLKGKKLWTILHPAVLAGCGCYQRGSRG